MAEGRFTITAKDRTKGAIDSAERGVNKLRGAYAALGGVVGGALVTGAMAKMVSKTLESQDALAKQADAIGVSTTALAGLQHAGELTGVSADKMGKALQRFNRSIGDAMTGTGIASQELKRLGLSAEDLAKVPADQAMAKVADAMNGVESSAERARIAQNLFGRSGVELLNTLDLGADGLAAMTAEAEALGIAISRTDAAKIEQTNDAILRVKQIGKGVANTFTAELAPAITAVATIIKQAALESGGFQGAVKSAADFVIKAVGYIGDTVQGMGLIWQGVKVAIANVGLAVASLTDGIINGPIRVLNMLPGIDIAPVAGIESFKQGMAEVALEAETELVKMADRPLWSDKFKAKIEDIKTQAAQAVGNASVAAPVIEAGAPAATDDAAVKAAEKERAQAQAQLERLRQSLLTEEVAIQESYERRQGIIDQSWGQGLITDETYQAMALALKREHQEKLTALEAKGQDRRQKLDAQAQAAHITSAADAFVQLATMAAGHHRAMFYAIKAVRISEAVVNTYAGATRALAEVPYPFNLVAAATVVAAGLANVASITSTGFGAAGGGGGGGSAPSAPASGSGLAAGGDRPTLAASEDPAKTAQPKVIQINTGGRAALGREGLREIMDGINEEHKDGYRLVIN